MENYSLIIICVLLFGFLGVLEIIYKFDEKSESKNHLMYMYIKNSNIYHLNLKLPKDKEILIHFH